MQNHPEIVSCASEIEARSIERGESSRELRAKGFRKLLFSLASSMFSSPPAKIHRILAVGEEFPYLGCLEILDTRGHTPGHISLWSSTTRTLFSGDSIRIDGNSLSPSRGANTWDAELAVKSFDLQMDLHPDRIYGGHGVWKRK
jgi:glyoxylase-like metal-dependent hydrolase (beta-lactamase superfamily II)